MKNVLLLIAIALICSCKKDEETKPSAQSKTLVYGCTDQQADNYNPKATSNACACPCMYSNY